MEPDVYTWRSHRTPLSNFTANAPRRRFTPHRNKSCVAVVYSM